MKLRFKTPYTWIQGFLKIILILTLLVPVGFGYSVYNDLSGKLKTEQPFSGRRISKTGCHFHYFQKNIFNTRNNKSSFSSQLVNCNRNETIFLKNQQLSFLSFKNKLLQLFLCDIHLPSIEIEHIG
jgi:hypothetical protein